MKLLTRPLGTDGETRSDAELIEAMQAGDEDAYGVLFSRHRAAVVRFSVSLTRDESTAEDVASEAFLRVFEMLETGRVTIEAFRPYVLRAARNVFLSRVRRDSKLVFVDDYTGHDMDFDMELMGEPDDAVRDRMVRAFESLPSTWQEVLWRTEVEGERPRHIAPSIGISPNATAALAVRAREGLRQEYLKTRFEGTEAPYETFFDDLVKWVRGAAGRRASARVSKQLDNSPELEALAEALRDEDRQLKCAMWFALIGCAPIVAYSTAASTIGAGGAFLSFMQAAEGVARNQLPLAAGVTAVVVATSAALPGMGIEGGEWTATGTSADIAVESTLVPSGITPLEDPVAVPEEDAATAIPEIPAAEEPAAEPAAPVEPAVPPKKNPDAIAPAGPAPNPVQPPVTQSRFETDRHVTTLRSNETKFNVVDVRGGHRLRYVGDTTNVHSKMNTYYGEAKVKARPRFCGPDTITYGATDPQGTDYEGTIYVTVVC